MAFPNTEGRAAAQCSTWNKLDMKLRSVDQQVMSILRTVLERCKKEKSNNCLQVPLEDYYERVSFYTGMPKMFVFHVLDDRPYEEDGFDDKDHIILMECINIFLAGKQNFIIKDLFEEFLKRRKAMKSDTQCTVDLNTFERKIYSLKYTYKKNLKGPPFILIEEPKVKFHRFNYLFKMKKFREKNLKIYYVDEKQISIPPFKSPVRNLSSKSTHEGLIFFHIVSANGYENGIYVCQDNTQSLEDTFKKWMVDIVLYSIKPGSVIVLANNYIHGSLPKKAITRYHSKKQMLQWLKDHNIPCDPNMSRPSLYELIEKCTINNKDYDIDRVFRLHGHHVLRLPNSFSSLSPTKFLWDFINKSNAVVMKNVVCHNFLLNYITNIDKPMWSTYFDLTCNMENQIFEIDLATEDLLEKNCELDEKCFYESSSNFNIEDFISINAS